MSILGDAKQVVQGAVSGVMEKAVALAPDSWVPGGQPDPLIRRQHGHIGQPVSRLDGPQKVAGQATFAAEFALEGMCYAALSYSTIARGRIASIDTVAAEAAPGVILVMTHRNAPRLKDPPLFMTAAKAGMGDSSPIMQDARIHWNGEPVALVLAETQEQADHAKSLIAVTYEVEEAKTSFDEAKASGTIPSQFMGHPLHAAVGDAEAAFAAAPVKVDHTYATPPHSHNPIELHAVTLAWQEDADGREILRLHDTTQMVDNTAWSMAQIFGLEEAQVRVTSPFVGGGFGSKGMWHHHVLGAAAAKLAGRPVRITLSREGVYRLVGGRAPTEQRVALGATEDGRITAMIHTGTTLQPGHGAMPEPFILASMSMYGPETMLLDVQHVELDVISNIFMRAPGEAVGTVATEIALDELAERLGMDPIELRLKNEPEKDPLKGLPFSMRETETMWRSGAAAFGWDRRQAPGIRREGEWLVGIGCAGGTYPYYRMPGGAARMTLRRDGAVQVDIAAHEMGMGTSTVQTQVAADRLGLPMDRVDFRYGDNTLPGEVLAGGSQQTASIGAAVIAAHKALVTELLKLAGNDSPLAGLTVEEVGGFEGGLAALSDPARHESYASILARAGREEVSVEASSSPPMETMHWSMHSHSAIFCEVRVNAITGEPRVSRVLGSFDVGRVLNPKTASSQFRGGIIMGLGLALMEETEVDPRTGRIMNPSLAEYHVPVHMDVPPIEVIWTDIPDPHSPMGAHGVGEIGITGVGAAVANAIYNATGKRVRDLPITLDKLL
ncbi:xanthine dehydrogenase family protein molybdopterin-binding subunit [Croceibacterium sp. TMG7-5b_MA50]|uniref:xanthine dehydrogenase family protein molybdopterin-binding subunit n=1 Tax=Croceibacterium sp. TMG7-5b_MA50 TaxID=3121290 RepID=UPI0032214BF6